MFEIRVPKLQDGITEVTIDAWLVAPGDTLEKDQAVARVSTKSHRMVLRTSRVGIVSDLVAREKSVLPEGSVLCLLDASDREVRHAKQENEDRFRRHLQADTIVLDREEDDFEGTSPTAVVGQSVPATPGAQRLANESGLSLPMVAQALGITGPIREEHVRAYLERG